MVEKSNETSFWVIGTNFLTAYLTIYDVDNQRMGFVKNFYIELPKPAVIYATFYTSITAVLAGSIIGGVALILIIAFVIYFCCRKKPKSKELVVQIE
jgi:hypothetical protein